MVSLETDETLYAAKRQKFLIDQGFSFEIVSDMVLPNNLYMSKPEEQRKHLGKLLENFGEKNIDFQQESEDSETESKVDDVEDSQSDTSYEEIANNNPLNPEVTIIPRK